MNLIQLKLPSFFKRNLTIKMLITALLISSSTLCAAQKFTSDFCNNLKILSNDAKNSYKNVVKTYKGFDKQGVYFISEREVGTDVYAVDTANSVAFFYRSFSDNATAQNFLNDVLEPELQKCYGAQNVDFDMTDFSRIWTLPSPKVNNNYKMTLSTKSSDGKILIACYFSFTPKK
jgi:hypothetical protein